MGPEGGRPRLDRLGAGSPGYRARADYASPSQRDRLPYVEGARPSGRLRVLAEFVALETDLGDIREKLGTQELNAVRLRLVEAYRVLAFPLGGGADALDLFSDPEAACWLESPASGDRRDAEATAPRTSAGQAGGTNPQRLRQNWGQRSSAG